MQSKARIAENMEKTRILIAEYQEKVEDCTRRIDELDKKSKSNASDLDVFIELSEARLGLKSAKEILRIKESQLKDQQRMYKAAKG